MTIKHLTIFQEVCRHLSITKAAEQLGMAQPAVSLSIKELESFYQTQLFERMNRRLYLTDAGRTLLTYAETILSQMEEARTCLTNSTTGSSLRIGANITFGTTRLPQFLEEYKKKNTLVQVSSHIGNSSLIESQLLQNELDLAIVDNLTESRQFSIHVISCEPMRCVCSPHFYECMMDSLSKDHYSHNSSNSSNNKTSDRFSPESVSISLAQLAEQPLLLREKGSGARSVVEFLFAAQNLIPYPAVESCCFEALIQCALYDQGIAILPQSILTEPLNKKLLIPINISDTEFLRTYYLIYHKQKYLTEPMKQFLQLLLTGWQDTLN